MVKGFVSAMMWGVLIGTYFPYLLLPLIALLGFKINKINKDFVLPPYNITRIESNVFVLATT